MNCDVCRAPMKGRPATEQAPYLYTLGGLPHVGLAGIVVYECATCRASVPVIPKIGELHRVLAAAFVRKPTPLLGSELRFLRKHAGFSAQEFAALLAVDPSHLSRVENAKGSKSLGPSTERLARAIVAAAAGAQDVRKMLLDRVASKLQQQKKRPATAVLDKNRWKLATDGEQDDAEGPRRPDRTIHSGRGSAEPTVDHDGRARTEAWVRRHQEVTQ